MAPPRKPNWRKAEIIAAAAECFMERGYQATTVDHVAARLNATKGRIYHHYDSKTDLFFDVHREGMNRLFAGLQPALEKGDGTARDRLHGMMLAHARSMLEHHTFENVVAQGVQVHRFQQVSPEQRATMADLIASRDAFEALFRSALQDAIDEGSVPSMDVSIGVKTLLGALQWSIFWYRPKADETELDRTRLAEKIVAPLISGF
ncbi:TetR/AcrR family transcriptional regulator [Pseudooceanicola sp. C21-150M6]|uniref:TetR/AcrR family transcriptional regulator n=1 Tax=Pseudooceanicola sp. C21-150M6 TaxID=3434355 RepID=UPI003D7FBED0